jgi:hypothetical protein
MPQSAKVEVQIDKNEIVDFPSYREDDEFAKSTTELCGVVNNGSDFSSIIGEENEFNYSEACNENFHSGYKRDALHR